VPPIQLDPRLPQALNDVILMSVMKDPGARFQTAAAFRNALANVAASSAAATVAQDFHIIQPTGPTPRGSRRALWMALGAVAALAAGIGLIEFAPWKGTRAATTAAPALQKRLFDC
jgi:hypothetical protein